MKRLLLRIKTYLERTFLAKTLSVVELPANQDDRIPALLSPATEPFGSDGHFIGWTHYLYIYENVFEINTAIQMQFNWLSQLISTNTAGQNKQKKIKKFKSYREYVVNSVVQFFLSSLKINSNRSVFIF
jgi:hypothetical protein